MSLWNSKTNFSVFVEGGYQYKKAKYASTEELFLLEETIKDLSLIMDRFSDKVLRKNYMPVKEIEDSLAYLKSARDKLYQRLKKRGQEPSQY